jgi:hypothetical protein
LSSKVLVMARNLGEEGERGGKSAARSEPKRN